MGKAEAVGYPEYMCIHRNCLLPESAAEYHVGGLSADTGKGNQFIYSLRDLPIEIAHQLPAALDDRPCLVPIISYAGYFALKLLFARSSKVPGRRVCLEEPGRHLVHSAVGALSGKDGCDQQLEGIAEPKGDPGIGIFF